MGNLKGEIKIGKEKKKKGERRMQEKNHLARFFSSLMGLFQAFSTACYVSFACVMILPWSPCTYLFCLLSPLSPVVPKSRKRSSPLQYREIIISLKTTCSQSVNYFATLTNNVLRALFSSVIVMR